VTAGRPGTGRVPAGPVELPPAGFVPEAGQAEILAGVLAGIELERWDVAFAGLYLDALESGLRGERVPGPWAAAFGAGRAVAPVRHGLLGMNAHINYDLPQALLAVISDAELGDPALLARREAGHRHIDRVLAALVDRADALSETTGSRSLPGRLAAPANRLATRRFLTEARAKVWANTRVLACARRHGLAAYQARRTELEHLATGRVADLARPGRCCCGSQPAASGSRSHPARIRRHGSRNTGPIMKETGR
jgi:hypothetical protein